MATQEIVIVLSAKNEASGPVKRLALDLSAVARFGTSGAFTPLMGAIKSIGKIALGVAAGGIAALGLGLGAIAKASVETAMEFQQQMANVAAIMEKPISEMAELEELAQAAAINPRFRVTLTQAAEAMEMLARNGVTAQQMMDGMLDSTILLSNSVNTDFKTAADIMTDAMNLFGDETMTSTDAVNQITGVINNSKFSIDDYFLALGRAGAGMIPIGASFSDFNTIISLIAPIFNSGMRAGTATVNFFNRLVPTTNKAKDAFLALGLAVSDEETGAFINNFFKPIDEGGGIKEMPEVIRMLSTALGGLPPAKQLENIITIFGRDAQPAITALLEFGDGFEALRDEIEGTDAFAAAATRMTTLDGALEITGGYFEALGQTIGDVFIPILTVLLVALQGVMEYVINWATPAFQGWEKSIKDVVDILFKGEFNPGSMRDWGEGILRIVGAFSDMSEMEYLKLAQDIGHFVTMLDNGKGPVELFYFALDKFGSSGLKTAVGNVIEFKDNVIQFMKDIKAWWDSDTGEKFQNFLDFLVTRFAILAGLGIVVAVISGVGTALAAMVTPLGIIAALIGGFVTAYKNDIGGFAQFVDEKVAEIKTDWDAMKTWWDDNGPEILFWLQSFGQTALSAFDVNFKPAFLKGLVALGKIAKGDFRGGLEGLAEAMQDIQKGMDRIGDQGARSGTNILNLLFGEGWQENLSTWFDETLETIGTFISEQMTMENLGRFMSRYHPVRMVADLIGYLFDTGALNESTGQDFFTNIMTFIADGIKAALALIWEIGFPPAWIMNNLIIPFFTGWAMEWETYNFDWGDTFLTIVENLLLDLVEAITGLDFTPVVISMTDSFKAYIEAYEGKEWGEIATAFIDMILGTIIALPMTVWNKLGDMIVAMGDWFASPDRDWTGVGQAIGEGVFNFFSDVGNFFDTMALALANVWQAIHDWFSAPERDWGAEGEGLLEAVWDGIKTYFSTGSPISLQLALGEVADAMEDWFHDPERPWNDMGKYTVEQMAAGIVNAIDKIKEAAAALWEGFVSGWKGAQASNPTTVPPPQPGGAGDPYADPNNVPTNSGGGYGGSPSTPPGGSGGGEAPYPSGYNFSGATSSGGMQFPTAAATGGGRGMNQVAAPQKATVEHILTWDESSAEVGNMIYKIAKMVVSEELAKNNRTTTARRRSGI